MGKPSIILHNMTNGYGVTFTTDREIDREVSIIFPLIPDKDTITLVSDEYLVDKITNEVTKQMDGRVSIMVSDELNKQFDTVISTKLQEMIDTNNETINASLNNLDKKHSDAETELEENINANKEAIAANKKSIDEETTNRKEEDRKLDEKIQDILDVFDPNATDDISGSIQDLKNDISNIRRVIRDTCKVIDTNPDYDNNTLSVTYYPSTDFNTERTLTEIYNNGFNNLDTTNNPYSGKKDTEVILKDIINQSKYLDLTNYYQRNNSIAYFLSNISNQLKKLGIGLVRTVPVGTIIALPYDGRKHEEITNNFLLCDGSEIDSGVYPELASKLSEDYIDSSDPFYTYDRTVRVTNPPDYLILPVAYYCYKKLGITKLNTETIIKEAFNGFSISMDDFKTCLEYYMPSSDISIGAIRSFFMPIDANTKLAYRTSVTRFLCGYYADYGYDSTGEIRPDYNFSFNDVSSLRFDPELRNGNIYCYLITITDITSNKTIDERILFYSKEKSSLINDVDTFSVIRKSLSSFNVGAIGFSHDLRLEFSSAKTIQVSLTPIDVSASYYFNKNNPFLNLYTAFEAFLAETGFFTNKTNYPSVLYSSLDTMTLNTKTYLNTKTIITSATDLNCYKGYIRPVGDFTTSSVTKTRFNIRYDNNTFYLYGDNNNYQELFTNRIYSSSSLGTSDASSIYLIYLLRLTEDDAYNNFITISGEELYNYIQSKPKVKWADTESEALCLYVNNATASVHSLDKPYFEYRGFGKTYMAANRGTTTTIINSNIYTMNNEEGILNEFEYFYPCVIKLSDNGNNTDPNLNSIRLPDLRDAYIKGTNEKPLVYKNWTIPRIYGKVKPDAGRAWTYAAYGAPPKDGFIRPINQGTTANASGIGSAMYIAGLDIDINYLKSYQGHTNDDGKFDVDHVKLQHWIKF